MPVLFVYQHFEDGAAHWTGQQSEPVPGFAVNSRARHDGLV
jgi:hypothetical protein